MRTRPPKTLRTGTWLLFCVACSVAGVAALRVLVAEPPSLDLSRQSKAPPRAIPGAGKEPVAETGRRDGFRMLAHVAGTSAVPEQPRRIVALGLTDEMLCIGIKPVGAVADVQNEFPEHLRSRLEGVVPLRTNAGAPNLEIIADLHPDLIVAEWWWKAHWPQLEKIAPTVMLQPGHWEWRNRVRDLAFICGRVAEGDAALAACDRRLETARRRIQAAAPGKSIAVLRIFAREFRLYGYAYSGPLLYGDLGVPRPKIVTDLAWDQEAARLSLEGLSLIDADVILLMTDDGDRIPITYQIVDRLLHHPMWASLPAVRNRQVYQVPNRFMRGGMLSRVEMADLLADLLEAGPAHE